MPKGSQHQHSLLKEKLMSIQRYRADDLAELFDKITKNDKIVFFNENVSLSEYSELRDLYIQKREEDGWLYLDFLVEGKPN